MSIIFAVRSFVLKWNLELRKDSQKISKELSGTNVLTKTHCLNVGIYFFSGTLTTELIEVKQ